VEAVVNDMRALVTYVSDLKCMSNELPLFHFFRCVLYSQLILNMHHSPLKKYCLNVLERAVRYSLILGFLTSL
jgi:hypothetical protein